MPMRARLRPTRDRGRVVLRFIGRRAALADPSRRRVREPRRVTSECEAVPPSRRRRPDGEPLRVLIVDDEQSMREWMRILFQRDGFEVLVAEDGIAARDLIGREYVDVLLTDIRMPRMDGIELLQAPRASIAPDTIVCMMTAHFTRDSEEWRRARDGRRGGALREAVPRRQPGRRCRSDS